jgi:hypothetical protein
MPSFSGLRRSALASNPLPDRFRRGMPIAAPAMRAITERTAESVDIRLVSSLTVADEDPVAARVMATLTEFLAALPIAYSVRIETASGKVLEHRSPLFEGAGPPPPVRTARKRESRGR